MAYLITYVKCYKSLDEQYNLYHIGIYWLVIKPLLVIPSLSFNNFQTHGYSIYLNIITAR